MIDRSCVTNCLVDVFDIPHSFNVRSFARTCIYAESILKQVDDSPVSQIPIVEMIDEVRDGDGHAFKIGISPPGQVMVHLFCYSLSEAQGHERYNHHRKADAQKPT